MVWNFHPGCTIRCNHCSVCARAVKTRELLFRGQATWPRNGPGTHGPGIIVQHTPEIVLDGSSGLWWLIGLESKPIGPRWAYLGQFPLWIIRRCGWPPRRSIQRILKAPHSPPAVPPRLVPCGPMIATARENSCTKFTTGSSADSCARYDLNSQLLGMQQGNAWCLQWRVKPCVLWSRNKESVFCQEPTTPKNRLVCFDTPAGHVVYEKAQIVLLGEPLGEPKQVGHVDHTAFLRAVRDDDRILLARAAPGTRASNNVVSTNWIALHVGRDRDSSSRQDSQLSNAISNDSQ